MINRHTLKDIIWIDLESPTHSEVRQIMDEFSIHPVVANEILTPTLRPRVDPYENFIYLILHFPTTNNKHNSNSYHEVDFIIGEKLIITTHYDMVIPLHEFSKVLEMNSLLDKNNIGNHAGFLFFYLMREFYEVILEDLDNIDAELERIEQKIFMGQEVDMVRVISNANRDLLNFKQATRHHKEVLESFEIAGEKMFGSDFRYYLRAITGESYKVANIIEGHKETVFDLRITNDSLLTTKTNEIMKILTIVAFITFPLTLISSLFGMNTENIPIIGMPHDFWLVIGIMFIGAMFMLVFFKRKKWI